MEGSGLFWFDVQPQNLSGATGKEHKSLNSQQPISGQIFQSKTPNHEAAFGHFAYF
jgi:hypothetical protein